jgi:hypothetical protein
MIVKGLKRHEIEVLLPWHAVGTLRRCEADLVERALAADRELARRYELVREELAQTVQLNKTLGTPSPRAIEKLFAAIAAEEGACATSPGRPSCEETLNTEEGAEGVRASTPLIEPTAGRSRKRMSMDRFDNIAILGVLLLFGSLSLGLIVLIY